MSILTFDIGTSSVKSGLFDRDTLACRWEHRTPLAPAERSGGEWDATDWLVALKRSCESLPQGASVDAVALSGNGPTIIPVDGGNTPTDHAYLWFGSNEARVSNQPSFFLPKIAWIRENRPRVYGRTKWFMTCPEYLSVELGAAAHVTSPSSAFDPYVWDEEGIAAYAADADRLPPIERPGAVVGVVSAGAAKRYGITAGAPIIACGPDFLAGLLGTAAVQPGRTCDRAGTSEGINYCSASPVRDRRVRTLPHAVGGLYNVAGLLSSTGRIFEWFRRISHQADRPYEQILGEIEAAGLAARPLFFPSSHHGAAWGFSTGAFIGLRSDHAAVDMGRAVVLAIGFAVRQSIETLREVGCPVGALRVCGGQARNAIWNQLKADITGCTVEVPEVLDAELLGAAVCAKRGLGDDADLADACERHVRIAQTREPRPRHHGELDELYGAYLELYATYESWIRSNLL